MLTAPAQTKQVSEGIGAFEPLGAGKPLKHRQLLDGDFWRKIPAYQHISREVFLDHIWQARNSITRPEQLKDVLQDLLPLEFYRDVALGFHRAPMSMRITPYILSLIDWSEPYEDPLRRQFITVGSRLLPDHPKLTLDSLHEQADSPVPGLAHRYGDRALFISLDTCPVYCRFCTRSYAVGTNTDQIEKVSIKAQSGRWERVFRYISSHPELEDILISGGDTYLLRPDQIRLIGETLLRFDNVRRIRFATKGPAVMPQKILTDDEWLAALAYIVSLGRKLHKDVALHTHFNHANEITQITKNAMDKLFELGITVRNQSVLQRGVNDSVDSMQLLVKRLSFCNVHPYYVYVHDLVNGVEDLRTSLQTGIDIDKHVRGYSAGYNTPTFACDAPGGGGKRNIHSYEHYDRQFGISLFTAPSVKTGYFLYFDPIDRLSPEFQEKWIDPGEQKRMIKEVVETARENSQKVSRSSSIRTLEF